MAELKPCPFCGSNLVHIYLAYLFGYVCQCKLCGASIIPQSAENLAKEAWNRRADNATD